MYEASVLRKRSRSRRSGDCRACGGQFTKQWMQAAAGARSRIERVTMRGKQ